VKEPLVKRAMEVLGTQLVDVEEGFGTGSAPSGEAVNESDSEEAGA
jgi:hypothetical protein